MNYTTNYHLPQWVEEDRILMEDFNDAMADIDQGLQGAKTAADSAQAAAAAAQSTASAAQSTADNAFCPDYMPFAAGNYTGTGEDITITLGFRPSAMLFHGLFQSGSSGGGNDYSLYTDGSLYTGKVQFTAEGFKVLAPTGSAYPHPDINKSGKRYAYLALR